VQVVPARRVAIASALAGRRLHAPAPRAGGEAGRPAEAAPRARPSLQGKPSAADAEVREKVREGLGAALERVREERAAAGRPEGDAAAPAAVADAVEAAMFALYGEPPQSRLFPPLLLQTAARGASNGCPEQLSKRAPLAARWARPWHALPSLAALNAASLFAVHTALASGTGSGPFVRPAWRAQHCSALGYQVGEKAGVNSSTLPSRARRPQATRARTTRPSTARCTTT